MNHFRQEVHDCVRALVELNKLKIVICAGLLAAAFGLDSATNATTFSYMMLCFVPVACVYVDCHYYHMLAKVFVIGKFLEDYRGAGDEWEHLRVYESFLATIRREKARGIFGFEILGQVGSSVGLSIIAPILGIVALHYETPSAGAASDKPSLVTATTLCLVVSVVFGIVGPLASYGVFKRKEQQMRALRLPEVPDQSEARTDVTGATPGSC